MIAVVATVLAKDYVMFTPKIKNRTYAAHVIERDENALILTFNHASPKKTQLAMQCVSLSIKDYQILCKFTARLGSSLLGFLRRGLFGFHGGFDLAHLGFDHFGLGNCLVCRFNSLVSHRHFGEEL